jgi:hypothetical protein
LRAVFENEKDKNAFLLVYIEVRELEWRWEAIMCLPGW